MSNDQNTNPDVIHAAVQSRYGRLAETSQSCCDGDCGCDSISPLYEVALNEVPADVAEFTLGCGDPISLAELQPGEVVVDLGSGGGLDAFLAARRVGPTGQVIGIDMTPAMIERATAARDRQGLTNVSFKLGQIENIPLADAFADVIISNCVINLAPDKPAVFREAFRILKPGGRLAVADMVSEGQLTPAEQANLDAWSECLTGAIDVNEYLDALRDAGFADVQVTHRAAVDIQGLSTKVFSARIVGRRPA